MVGKVGLSKGMQRMACLSTISCAEFSTVPAVTGDANLEGGDRLSAHVSVCKYLCGVLHEFMKYLGAAAVNMSC